MKIFSTILTAFILKMECFHKNTYLIQLKMLPKHVILLLYKFIGVIIFESKIKGFTRLYDFRKN